MLYFNQIEGESDNMKSIYLVVSIVPYEGKAIEYITDSKEDLKRYLQIAKEASLFLYRYLHVLVVNSDGLPLTADDLNFQDTSNYDT
ncbi:MAG: hypothetical protein XD93_0864 [candidate division WS6 bacterium 34_10]|uniref:Uncharacterized protein n=1 Tax=candidate division WS6 bacterium 34_10 TaxID=1641389 RepID=A0A124FX05_9BACT|nr:MAG: hypothetical protein XD93_0864 [candidate division WS6 bacterium 34_10]